MENKKQEEQAHAASEKRQKFLMTVHQILEQDCTQTCINTTGTKLQVHQGSITIMDSISHSTIEKFMEAGLNLGCDEQGRLTLNPSWRD